jgi:dihydrofolate reductase
VICGRRTYDASVPWWEADGPTGPARRPVIVLTHELPATSPPNGVYQFVTDGIAGALERAKDAAGDKDVCIMGGADVGRQFLESGLVDEISVHLVPVLFGAGTRMFDDLGPDHTRLEPVETVETAAATHLRYRVIRRARQ